MVNTQTLNRLHLQIKNNKFFDDFVVLSSKLEEILPPLTCGNWFIGGSFTIFLRSFLLKNEYFSTHSSLFVLSIDEKFFLTIRPYRNLFVTSSAARCTLFVNLGIVC